MLLRVEWLSEGLSRIRTVCEISLPVSDIRISLFSHPRRKSVVWFIYIAWHIVDNGILLDGQVGNGIFSLPFVSVYIQYVISSRIMALGKRIVI